jgi:hypothetical protein
MPTEAEVTGEVPEGHYSRKQLLALQDALYERLFLELEAKVARGLRVPGQ